VPASSSRSPGAIWLAPFPDTHHYNDVTATSALRALSKFFREMCEEGYDHKDIIVLDVVKKSCNNYQLG
jgi:hypothetical protein